MSATIMNTIMSLSTSSSYIGTTLSPSPLLTADKVSRQLFVGNIQPGTPEHLLIEFFNGAMRRVSLSPSHHKPIIHCEVNPGYAFIECATAEDASRALNLNGIPFMGVFLRVSRPSHYNGPILMSKTWQELTGQQLFPGVSPFSDLAVRNKTNRELFVGNITSEMTVKSVTEFLANIMKKVGLTTQEGNPILSCRLKNKFAFVEFRSEEEASNALNLDNIPFMGVNLKVGRPSKYEGPQTAHGNWDDILARILSGELEFPARRENRVTSSAISNPTRIVELRNILTVEDLESVDACYEIMRDVKHECQKYGLLKNVVIPRVGDAATKIYVEYASTEDATRVIQTLTGRSFDGRTVQASHCNEEVVRKVLDAGQYDGNWQHDADPVLIIS